MAFACPTRVHSGRPYHALAAELIGGRRWSLVTSAGWARRRVIGALTEAAGPPAAIVDEVPENPKVSDVFALAEGLPEVDVVVALGGGSVIDCAKGLVAFRACGRDQVAVMAHLRDGADLPQPFAPVPLIAIPTTSGTGSEVTRWATIWGDEKVKFSLAHPSLYPAHAILDPALCVSMPPLVTLASGLDALSHAMEAIWNRNHTLTSDQLACAAIRSLRVHLPRVLRAPGDVAERAEVQVAALIAGLAMSTTQTALAHSISYPFTARFGMPHGLACSFTLPEVARYNGEADPARVGLIAALFDCACRDLPEALSGWLDGLSIGTFVGRYVDAGVADRLSDQLITRARAANNIRDVTGAEARQLVRRSLERLCAGRPGTARSAR